MDKLGNQSISSHGTLECLLPFLGTGRSPDVGFLFV